MEPRPFVFLPLFTQVHGIEILGSSDAGFWIRPRNTPAPWPWAGPSHVRGGRYYLRLDAYAYSWKLLPDNAPPPREALYALLSAGGIGVGLCGVSGMW
jgi:hypothetical protein